MLKGVMGAVSLHLESGQALDAENPLDFGDCYAGLVAVRTVWLTNTCTGPDQRIFAVTLSSDCPAEVDFDVSQSAGSSSQARVMEFDTAAKRREQVGILINNR
jgi:hypothetical protein